MLNIIFLYFTKKTRQKTQNSNFKNLFLRIQKELETREKENDINENINNENGIKKENKNIKQKEKKFKIKFKIEVEDIKRENKKKITQIEEVNIPNFFNDKPIFPISKINLNNLINCNSSLSLSTASFEEETLRDEIERLKQEKYDLINEMSLYKKNNDNDKEIEPDINNIFSYTKINDLNFDFEPNLFIKLDNNHNNLYYENDKEKFYKEENLFFPQF